jgi:hypothetical protein
MYRQFEQFLSRSGSESFAERAESAGIVAAVSRNLGWTGTDRAVYSLYT